MNFELIISLGIVEKILTPVALVVKHFISMMGYWGIFIGMFIESICIPLPSEIIMPFGGYLASEGKLNFHLVVLAGTMGNVVGGLLLYIPAAHYGDRILNSRFSKWLFKPHELEAANKFFDRWGNWAGLIGRMLPIIRTFISLPLGIARVNFGIFILFCFIGSYPWCLALTYCGYLYGENLEGIKPYLHYLDLLVIIGVLILFGLFIRNRVKKSQSNKNLI